VYLFYIRVCFESAVEQSFSRQNFLVVCRSVLVPLFLPWLCLMLFRRFKKINTLWKIIYIYFRHFLLDPTELRGFGYSSSLFLPLPFLFLSSKYAFSLIISPLLHALHRSRSTRRLQSASFHWTSSRASSFPCAPKTPATPSLGLLCTSEMRCEIRRHHILILKRFYLR